HLSLLGVGIFSFLLIPFIFLANINLMLFPEQWGEVNGFFEALTLPNVFPRYFHFITASMAITGLFLAWWFGRKSFDGGPIFQTLSKIQIKKQMLNLTLIATGMQFIFGPLLFLTLPSQGISWTLFWLIMGGVTIAVIVMVQLWKLINNEGTLNGKRFYMVVGLFTVLVAFMGTGRHVYRANALETHRQMMAERTAAHWEAVKLAHENLLLPQEAAEHGTGVRGQNLFQTNCAVCHAPDTRLVGPPMNEITPLYKDNPEQLKQWIKEPGRKRMDYPPMAGFPHFSDEQLTEVAEYMLKEQWNN
ncbi:MAG: c-type cytochrome, partial [Bacteroidota bacterium]